MSELAEHPLAIGLIVAYGVLLLFTVALLTVLCCQASVRTWKPRFTFLVLILLLAALRVALFCLLLLDDSNNAHDDGGRTWYFWGLFNLCALLYLSIFTELMLFWAQLHDSLRPPDVTSGSVRFSDRQRRFVQFVALLVAWLVYVGVFVTFFYVPFAVFTAIVSYVTCFFFAIAAIFFAVYGARISRRVLQMPVRSAAVTARVRRVLAVAVIVTAAFVARAVLNAALPTLLSNATVSEQESWVLYTVAFLCTEVLPLFLVELLVVLPYAQQNNGNADVESSVRTAYRNHYAYHPVSSGLKSVETKEIAQVN